MQLTLDFESGISTAYPTCREYVAHLVHHQGRPQKAIAADMDYSPSDLSRKLAQHDDDSRRFTLDDLERFINVTGDKRPVLYLVEKYFAGNGREELRRRIAELEQQLKVMEKKK